MATNQRSTPPPPPPDPPCPEPTNEDRADLLPPLTPLTLEQLARVDEALPDVEQCAADVARLYRRRFTPEEMLGPGTLGLLAAVRAYDSDRHPSFRHYAKYYIRGAMLNTVRTELFSSRARIEHAMERAACDFEVHHHLDIDVFTDSDEQLLQGGRRGCDDGLAAALVAAAAEAQALSPEEAIVEHVSLADALSALHAGEREVTLLVHGRGLSVAEAARELGVHTNTAQNRYQRAVRKLRAFLLQEEEPRRR
jgi:RNA polymerase sigma factor (sigma-70 family)